MPDCANDIAELRARIRVLSAENEMLAEKAEDSFLLGLIVEQINLQTDGHSLLETALEKIAVLKDLLASVCWVLKGRLLTVEAAYLVSSDCSLRDSVLPLSPGLQSALEEGVLLLSSGQPEFRPFLGLFESVGMHPATMLLIPFKRQGGETGVYLFADEHPEERLDALTGLLQRLVEMVAVRQDNLFLMAELRQMNVNLDALVDTRTDELLQANATLKQEIAERRKAEDALRALVEEKVVLLREVHHRVKNNLQVISSLLSLQQQAAEDPVTKELLRETRGRVQSMARIHEKLYQTRNVAEVDFGEYVRTLTRELLHSYGVRNVRVDVVANDVHLHVDTAIPCGLIINELVTNALKHGFKGGREGTITVELALHQSGMLHLRVADDGVGFGDGVDYRDARTMGMVIVRSLVAQLAGAAELSTDSGTEFLIRFPLHAGQEASEG
jgi:two-component sensor histidine kinase